MSTASPPRSCSCLQLATGSYQILEEEQTEKLGKFSWESIISVACGSVLLQEQAWLVKINYCMVDS
ncbi:hypothetical protein BS78_K008400 [Paspalum vaginatum]|uniref:Uncharacterized protein n=1 Tax=Paspalum vaginatum TaxID=158149 RepID=A0A9W8CEC5_9POAL|nr:hypothetical protein BS78_K008400 [Paspalum vaginatum]